MGMSRLDYCSRDDYWEPVKKPKVIKRIGRPPKEIVRDMVVRAKVTEDEYELIRAAAQVHGTSISGMLRDGAMALIDKMTPDQREAMDILIKERWEAM